MSTRAIDRLPTEALRIIFAESAHTNPPRRLNTSNPYGTFLVFDEDFSPLAYDLGWIHLSHICRQWRALSLSMPSLWAGIVRTLPHPDALETILARAQDEPLSMSTVAPVYPEMDIPRNAAICDFAFSRIRNIRSLQLHFGRRIGREFDGRAREALSFWHLPLLTELSLSLEDDEGYDTPPIDAPNLKTATLKGLWCRFSSHNLQYLDYTVSTGQQTSIIRLIDILRQAPQLQTLRLAVDFSRSTVAVTMLPHTPIDLPNLKLLCTSLNERLSDARIEDVVAFYQLVSIPPSCTVHLNDVSASLHADEWRYSLDACGHFLRHASFDAVGFYALEEWKDGFCASVFHQARPPKPNPRAHNIDRKPRPSGAFQGLWHEPTRAHKHLRLDCCPHSSPAEPLPESSVRLQITPISGSVKAHEVLPRVIAYLQPTAITYLVLDGMNEDDATAIREALRPLTAVTTLIIRSRLNKALRAFSADSEADEGQPACLPALRDMTVTFFGIMADWDDMVSKWWMELVSALEYRGRIRLPVRKLRIVGGWSNRPREDKTTSYRSSAYDEEVGRDTALAVDADDDGSARVRELVEELADERIL